MTRLLALAALTALCACARQEPPPPAPSAPPAAESAPAAPAAPSSAPATAVGAQSETEQATGSQESPGTAEAEHTGSDASLEKIAGAPPATPLPESKWQPGVNYTLLVPAQPTSVAPGKVEVLEVFWLACPHCYALEPFIKAWAKSKPSYVEFVRVPVMWQAVHRSHAQLYYTLEVLGRQDLVAKVMDTMAQQRDMLFTGSADDSFKVQQQWAVRNGVNADEFAKAYSSFTVNSDLQRAEELTNRYHVEGVPFIVVNGKYATDVIKAGGEAKLIELINDLAAAEHRH
ncbi:MAG TPA: thiol:disulfide interchange protein DsbA/DsbL [Steroidobacteraceae bacterium]|nr:thiol:disulfide interchange protein DsbA/DsbL [Steroidobacteraceae bacterium]